MRGGIGAFLTLLASLSSTALLSCRKPVDLDQYRKTAPVILISIDTLRADHLPAYGYRQVETPAIDQFARDAVVFDRCYAHCPQTLPSHCSMLTGCLPYEHGVRDNIGFTLKAGQPTLASILKGVGFATGGFVSAYVLRAETGLAGGFQTYDAEMKRERGDESMGELQRSGAQTIAKAREWLERIRSEGGTPRYFLFLHLYEPHSPYAPLEPFKTRYSSQPYDGEIASVDSQIGTFLLWLKETGQYDRSLILLTSDHGEGLGDHGEREHGVFVYNEDIHVPMMIKLPGGARAGDHVKEPVQHIDIVPTILDFCRLPSPPAPPPSFQGRTMIGARSGLENRVIYSESLFPLYHFGWSDLYALTDAKYKFIKAPREELYSLSDDPAEKKNLAAALKTIAGQYRSQLGQAIAGRAVDAPEEVNAEEIEKLQALGYIGVATARAGDAAARPDPKDKVHLLEEFRRGLQMHRKGDEAGAVRVFEAIVRGDPEMADVLEQLGRSLGRVGRTAEAAQTLVRAAALRSDSRATLVRIARILWIELGLTDEALRLLEQAAKISPLDARELELLGQVLYMMGNTTAALRVFDQALSRDPSLPWPYYIRGVAAMKSGRIAEAVRLLRRAEEESLKRKVEVVMPSLHFYLGVVLAQDGQEGAALTQYEKELGIRAENLSARINLALLLLHAGKREEAVRLFDDPHLSTPQSYTVAAKFLASIGEHDRAARIGKAGSGER
ncbi:MAG: sulfatase-like hydrolase/transferase [Acidobacteria bacterium]|nr:sulfatase-like hydrolase/transferase [Acidobacteriota bacterium]